MMAGRGREAGLRAAPLAGLRAMLAALALVIVAILPAAALDFPALAGRVVDEAGILDAATRMALDQKLAALEAKSTDQLVVVTLASLRGTTIEDYGYQLGRHWQIGQKGKNNGVLLIVAPTERKVRIEVGYGLEGTLTDAATKVVIQTAMVPKLRTNDFAGGLVAGTDAVIAILTGDEEWKARAQPVASRQGGDIAAWIAFALFAGVFALIVLMILKDIFFSTARAVRDRKGSRDSSASDSGTSSGSSWSSDSSSSSSDSGFSGGGGDFGGGGSSGDF